MGEEGRAVNLFEIACIQTISKLEYWTFAGNSPAQMQQRAPIKSGLIIRQIRGKRWWYRLHSCSVIIFFALIQNLETSSSVVINVGWRRCRVITGHYNRAYYEIRVHRLSLGGGKVSSLSLRSGATIVPIVPPNYNRNTPSIISGDRPPNYYLWCARIRGKKVDDDEINRPGSVSF